MQQHILEQMCRLATTPESLCDTRKYLADHLRPLVGKGDVVLLCFQNYASDSLGGCMEQAVVQCDAEPIRWGPDFRWKGLIQQAFLSRAKTIIGPPLLILGITKLIKYQGIPLYIRNVITVSYPCLDWMIDGIANGLDCSCSGCFSVGDTAIVAGFSCDRSGGVHIRSEIYGVDIVDAANKPVAPGSIGEMKLYLKDQPMLRYSMGEQARLVIDPCPCGEDSYRLVDLYPGSAADMDLVNLGQQLLSWTSILDCRLKKGKCGLEMELVVFPGEKLPMLPSAAKQVIRPWNPNRDIPFPYGASENNLGFFKEID